MASTPTVASSGTQTATAGGTTDTLYSTTTAGTYILNVDCTALVDDEVLRIEINHKTLTGSTVRGGYVWTVIGTLPVYDQQQWSVPITTAFGADFKITQLNGTGRALPWQVIQP